MSSGESDYTYRIETCSGSGWDEVYTEESDAFKEAVKRANGSKHDVYVVKRFGDIEKPIIRIYHHFIDDFGYYNPTHVIDLRTFDSYYVSHNVEYCSHIKGYFWGEIDEGFSGKQLEPISKQ